ncbi:sulfatase [Algoriphagus marinus]|uniref:sulfatase n=1 Tax=Algoriphagus marinus TaxID=1925762 RepID=UPI00094B9DB1|nr:sulfatase [Algoriphagus marinus]
MKKLLITIISFLAFFQSYSQEMKPNIILINVDDMGWKDLGFMGSDYYETPFLDSLAGKGMIFDNGYSGASNCAPSRASLLTGLWSSRHHIITVASSERGKSINRKIIPIQNTMVLSKAFVTFPQVLQKNGYQTLHAGKWHISESPNDFGFDESIGGGSNGAPKSYYPPYGNVNWDGPETVYLSDAIIGKMITKINQLRSPYLLYYSPYTVHTPIQGKAELAKKYVDKSSGLGQNNSEYASMVENLDSNLKLLFSALKQQKLLENILIVFTSDNGGLKGITSQPPLRSGKGSYYEGGIRVPMLFVWNGKIQSGINSTPITQLDLFPTILAAAGIQSEMNTDGINLLPLLEAEEQLDPRPLFWHFPIYLEAYSLPDPGIRDSLFRTRPGSVIRQGKWKLHYYFETKEIELFDLEADISEKTDLSKSNPEVASKLLDMMKKWWQETNAPIPTQANPEYIGN